MCVLPNPCLFESAQSVHFSLIPCPFESAQSMCPAYSHGLLSRLNGSIQSAHQLPLLPLSYPHPPLQSSTAAKIRILRIRCNSCPLWRGHLSRITASSVKSDSSDSSDSYFGGLFPPNNTAIYTENRGLVKLVMFLVEIVYLYIY